MKYCKHCGREVDEKSNFCSYCGKDQASPSACKLFIIKMINSKRFEILFVAIMAGLVYGSIVYFFLLIIHSKLVPFVVGLLFFIVAFISTVRYKRRTCNDI